MELTTNLRKLIKGASSVKHRRENGIFIAEGTKCVLETINAFQCRHIVATAEWFDTHCGLIEPNAQVVVKQADIERMSLLKTPQSVITVYELPERNMPVDITGRLMIALDRVQDPGNMGTIMRIADWFGIHDILASHDTVDCFNPKVVQATMGAIGRVSVHYVNLPETLKKLSGEGINIYGTFLDGEDIYNSPLSDSGIIVMGNEGNGISEEVASTVNSRLLIPPYPADSVTVESLNVSMATAIVVAEFRRRGKNI